MGTRADFYIGRGESAEWLGSIAWDGYPDGIDKEVLNATTEADFRASLAEFFAKREDVSLPADGWPWPWDDSQTTDYAYALDSGKVCGSCFGQGWFDPLIESEEQEENPTEVPFPDMRDRKNVQLGGEKSGIIIVRSK